MGWTFTSREKGISDKQFFQREWGSQAEILESSRKGMTIYQAIRYTDNNGVVHVGGMVILTQLAKDMYNFGYKDIDEQMGPCEADCPDKILDLLTPTESEYAIAWRQRCRENNANRKRVKAVAIGDKITLKDPLKFNDGAELSEFIVVPYRSRKVFKSVANGCLYRISRLEHREFSVTRG